ncbi:fused MFS/spermidine synthase [Massilia sp. Leaf139]|uniref:fused MFS/spermidine synthase n=1 Tax=Massilia sp. Leaf139 TaxID=1736272 RepID=UPI000A7065F2|nr:fused MFS/spermidine synthase [Massilia sp. Leaf139]
MPANKTETPPDGAARPPLPGYTAAMPPRSDHDSDPPSSPRPLVRTRGNRRTLEFENGEIQSEMLLSQPDKLVLAYARAMMCFALFVPQPRHILMVGLGGGSLVKFCHRHFPHTRITVLEISAEVIALREAFQVPPDDARLRIVHGDAADFVCAAPGRFDVILVDGFDAAGMPAALGSAAFYRDCRRALFDGGVLVANVLSYDPCHDAIVARIEQAFSDRVCDFPGIAGNNHLLFALRAPTGAASRAALRQEAFARRRGLGLRVLNWLLPRALLAWLTRRPV